MVESGRRALVIGARFGATDDQAGDDPELKFAEELAVEFDGAGRTGCDSFRSPDGGGGWCGVADPLHRPRTGGCHGHSAELLLAGDGLVAAAAIGFQCAIERGLERGIGCGGGDQWGDAAD
jgi:hypothetical protein